MVFFVNLRIDLVSYAAIVSSSLFTSHKFLVLQLHQLKIVPSARISLTLWFFANNVEDCM